MFQIEIPVEGIQFQDVKLLKIRKMYQQNVAILEYSVFVVSRDCIIQPSQVSWKQCEITFVEENKQATTSKSPQSPKSPKNVIKKCLTNPYVDETGKTLDILSFQLYTDIDRLLVSWIGASRLYLEEFQIKGLINNQSVHLIGQSLHLQGEKEQAVGLYLKTIAAYLEKNKIIECSKLIVILPYQFGELNSPREHVRICLELLMIDLGEENIGQVLNLLIHLLEKDGEPMSWEPWKAFLGGKMLQIDIQRIVLHGPFTTLCLSQFRITYTLHQGWSCSVQKIEIQDTTPREWNYVAYSQGELSLQQYVEETYSLKQGQRQQKWVGEVKLPRLMINLDEFWIDMWLKYILHLYLPLSRLMSSDTTQANGQTTAPCASQATIPKNSQTLDELRISSLELSLSFKSRNTHVKDLPKYMYQGEWLRCLQLSSLHDATLLFQPIHLVDVNAWHAGIDRIAEEWFLALEGQGARLVSQLDGWKHLFSILRHIPSWKKVVKQPFQASFEYTKNVSGDVLDLCTRTLISIDKLIQKKILGKAPASQSQQRTSYYSEAPTSWKKGLQKAVKTPNILKSAIYILSGFHASIHPERKMYNQLRYKKKDEWYNVGDVSTK